jgi:hypothetical protein
MKDDVTKEGEKKENDEDEKEDTDKTMTILSQMDGC